MPIYKHSSLFAGDVDPKREHRVKDIAWTLELDYVGSATYQLGDIGEISQTFDASVSSNGSNNNNNDNTDFKKSCCEDQMS